MSAESEDQTVIHRHHGRYWFTIFALPEGDHWRWSVNCSDKEPPNHSHFGQPLAGEGGTGMAPTQKEAQALAEEWLDKYLTAHPVGA